MCEICIISSNGQVMILIFYTCENRKFLVESYVFISLLKILIV